MNIGLYELQMDVGNLHVPLEVGSAGLHSVGLVDGRDGQGAIAPYPQPEAEGQPGSARQIQHDTRPQPGRTGTA